MKLHLQTAYGAVDDTKFLKDLILFSKNDGTYVSPTYGAGATRVITVEEFLQNFSQLINVKITLTAAQIKTGNTTPITILAAVATTHLIDVISANARFRDATVAFDDVVGEMTIQSSGGPAILTTGVGFSNTLAGENYKLMPDIYSGLRPLSAGTGIEAKFSGDSTVGDGLIDIYLSYRLVKL